jgi:anaerobic sulfite reductase subunit B
MENIMLPEPHQILDVVKETQAEYTFRVAYDKPTKYNQFFQLSIPKVGEAPISVSGKGNGYLEFTMRKVGRLTEGVFGLSKGDTLFMRGPYGNSFPVADFEGKDLVVICGGTGMSPVKTVLTHFMNHPEISKSVHFIVGFKDINSVLFTDALKTFSEQPKFHTTYCLDNSDAPGFHKGFVTQYIKNVPFADFEDYNVAIVGPPMMMGFSAQECLKNGADPKKIWVSFERRMSCAVGKCGHCKINDTYVCLDGPVFNYTKAAHLFD